MQRDRLLQNKIHQAFRRSEHQLLKALEARKGEVKVRSRYVVSLVFELELELKLEFELELSEN